MKVLKETGSTLAEDIVVRCTIKSNGGTGPILFRTEEGRSYHILGDGHMQDNQYVYSALVKFQLLVEQAARLWACTQASGLCHHKSWNLTRAEYDGDIYRLNYQFVCDFFLICSMGARRAASRKITCEPIFYARFSRLIR